MVSEIPLDHQVAEKYQRSEGRIADCGLRIADLKKQKTEILLWERLSSRDLAASINSLILQLTI